MSSAYDNVQQSEFKNHVKTSMVRYLKTVGDDEFLKQAEQYEFLRRKFNANCHKSEKAARWLKQKLRSDEKSIVISSHAFYSTFGPFIDFLKSSNIDVFTYGMNGYVNDAIDIGINEPAAFKRLNTINKKYSGICKKDWVKVGKDEISKRLSGQAVDIERLETKAIVNAEAYKIPSQYKSSALLLPNVIWDAIDAFADYNLAFEGLCDWICKTVEWYIANPDHYLVIKPHPGEGTLMHVNLGVRDYLSAKYPNLSRSINIKVMSHDDSKINSTEVLPQFDKIIVYNGTVLYEAIAMKKPVIVAAQVPLPAGMNYYLNASTVDEYYSLLNQSNYDVRSVDDDFYEFCGIFFDGMAVRLKTLSKTKWLYPRMIALFHGPINCSGLNFLSDEILERVK
jgi:hypothetical protein